MERLLYAPGDVLIVRATGGRKAVLHCWSDPQLGSQEVFLKSGAVIPSDGTALVERWQGGCGGRFAGELVQAGWVCTNMYPPTVDSGVLYSPHGLVFQRIDFSALFPVYFIDSYWLNGGIWQRSVQVVPGVLSPERASDRAEVLRLDFLSGRVRARLLQLRKSNGPVRTREEEQLLRTLQEFDRRKEQIDDYHSG